MSTNTKDQTDKEFWEEQKEKGLLELEGAKNLIKIAEKKLAERKND